MNLLLKLLWLADLQPQSKIQITLNIIWALNWPQNSSQDKFNKHQTISPRLESRKWCKCDTDLLEILEVSSVIDLSFFNLRLEIPMWAMYWLIKERPLVNDQGIVGGKKQK